MTDFALLLQGRRGQVMHALQLESVY
jgi:hypothetical protein